MMILSRAWYIILAILLAGAYYIVSLAVGQYNRRNHAAMEETLKSDSQVVKWALDVDSRRRLDALFLASTDAGVVKAIKGANGAKPGDSVPVASRDEGTKALRAYNEKLPEAFKSDVMFAVDREGRMVSQIGYDIVNASPEFELGGYPAVLDALHGFARDDTWVWGGKIARVIARPVEDEAGQPPLGAVVALKWADNAFAKMIGARTRTNLAFFALGQRVASAAQEGFDDNTFTAMQGDLATIAENDKFKAEGRTDVKPLIEKGDDKGGVLFVRLQGEAWDLGGGFAVARTKVKIDTPLGFIQGADDADKKNVKMWLVAVVVIGAILFGFLFSFLEHSMPLKELGRQALRLKRGEIDQLQLPRLRGGYRPVGQDINDGIQRVVEKGGGTARKPADLESILGPVPAQPNMSAFTFPMADGSMPPQQAPTFGAPPGGPGGPGPIGAPGSPNSRPNMGGPPPPGPRPPGAPPPPNTPAGFPGVDRTFAMGNAGPAPSPGPPPPFNPPSPAGHSATVAASPQANVNKTAPSAAAPFPAPPGAAAPPGKQPKEEDEQTMVAQPSADLIKSASGAHPVVPGAPGADPPEWQAVYEEFIRTKRECGEPTDGLTYEKFQQTLKKNRDALMQRHGCKRVKFSVYVKEGRASLKATPVRD